jgi:hypothetical protein
MTDVAPTDSPESAVQDAPVPLEPPVGLGIRTTIAPEVQAELDRIRADKEARIAAAVQAQEAEGTRLAALDAAKAKCFAACGPLSEAAANATDEEERQAILAFEQSTHAGHAAELEQAYLVFSGQREGNSNPAGPGVTDLESHATAGVDVTQVG